MLVRERRLEEAGSETGMATCFPFPFFLWSSQRAYGLAIAFLLFRIHCSPFSRRASAHPFGLLGRGMKKKGPRSPQSRSRFCGSLSSQKVIGEIHPLCFE